MTIGPGARAAGMGEAFVAVADDPTATYWNPAGLGRYPLSSRWHTFHLPDSAARFFAVVKTARADVDFRKYDLWAAAPKSLWMMRRDRWYSCEEYTVSDPDGEGIRSILSEFANLKSYEQTYVDSVLVPKVLQFNGLSDTLVPYDTKLRIPFVYFVADSITALCGGDRVLWIGTVRGLYRYSHGVWRREAGSGAPEGKRIVCIDVDKSDNVWVGTDGGLFVKKGTRWTHYTSSNGLPSSRVTAVFARSPRDVWVATQRGVAHFNGASWRTNYTFDLGEGKSWEQAVEEVCGAKGTQRKRFLISTLKAENGALELESPPKSLKVPYNLVLPLPVRSIYVDGRGDVWFGSELGLVRFDGKCWKTFGWRGAEIKEPVSLRDWVDRRWSGLSEATKERLAEKIRVFGAINARELKPGEVVEYPANPASGEVFDIGAGFAKNDVLIATEYGLLRYYPNLRQFRYVMSGGMKGEDVVYLASRGGEFWFGVDGAVKIYSKGKPAASLMHVKWLPELASDIYYEYLTGVYYLEDWGTVGGAVTYISLGHNEQTNEAGEVLGGFYSYETAIALSYGSKLLSNLYGGLTFKFIYSALAPRIYVGHEKKSGTGSSFAVDLGLLYDGPIPGLSFGVCVQNLGPDIHYIDAAQADPLPRNLKVGMAYRILRTDYQKLVVAADIDKEIIKFKQPENPWALEWHYAVKHVGVEYTYSNFFSLRAGYIIDYDYYPKSEALDKVNKPGYKFDPDDYIATNYFTFGLGIHYGRILFDFAYIPKVTDPENQNANLPLSDIKRFSLTVEF